MGDDRAILVASMVKNLSINFGEIIAVEMKIRILRTDTAYHFPCLITELGRAANVPKIA